ncbi:MAG: regulatory protein RecX [Candidatus Omnitrophica bacterium]|nr:regulatory protein RecX [Candidatus Omnitrophota bacterium]
MEAGPNEKINKDSENKKALSAASRLLKFRPRSEQEIAERLAQKEFSRAAIAVTISYLKKHVFIDDDAFSQAWIASRLKKPYGEYRIRLELKQKGIADNLIAKNLSAAFKDYDEHTAVFDIARRRLEHYYDSDNQSLRRKLYGYLNRRGFNQRTIIQTINKLLNES